MRHEIRHISLVAVVRHFVPAKRTDWHTHRQITVVQIYSHAMSGIYHQSQNEYLQDSLLCLRRKSAQILTLGQWLPPRPGAARQASFPIRRAAACSVWCRHIDDTAQHLTRLVLMRHAIYRQTQDPPRRQITAHIAMFMPTHISKVASHLYQSGKPRRRVNRG